MINYRESINTYFNQVRKCQLSNNYDFIAQLIKGVELLLELRRNGVSKDCSMAYCIEYYLDYGKKENISIEFDNFLTDFIAEIKGLPWSKNLDFWDPKISFNNYYKSLLK